jgi:hypothetical protein
MSWRISPFNGELKSTLKRRYFTVLDLNHYLKSAVGYINKPIPAVALHSLPGNEVTTFGIEKHIQSECLRPRA